MNVGDTCSVAGVFRALRTIPIMLSICRDMEELCPDAILLNYTNPMAMLCRAMQRETKIKVTGLCHSVQNTAHILALANRRGFISAYVGPRPPQLAALNNASIAVEEMAVEAAITGNPEMVFHSIAYDPLSAAVLSLSEIKQMVQAMLNCNRPYLPQFKDVKIKV